MTKYHPNFKLINNAIIWKKQKVGEIQPLSQLKTLTQEDCYIVATGPSIKTVDLTQIDTNSAICGVNGAIALAKQQNLKFDFYVIVDSDFIKMHFDMVHNIIQTKTHLLLSSQNINLICERDPKLLHDANIYILDDLNARYNVPSLNPAEFEQWAEQDLDLILHPRIKSQDRVGFSKNIEKGIFGGGTVVFDAVQVTYYIGYKNVFILGMDLGFSGKQPRFYNEGKKTCHSSLDKYYETVIKPSFEVLTEFCKTENFAVYNLSPTSRLPDAIIPKIPFPPTN